MSNPLTDGYHDVPAGKLASVVTSLEMRMRPPARPDVPGTGWSLRHEGNPDVDWYRALFARMGRDWLWFSRLNMGDRELSSIVRDPRVQVHALEIDGHDQGLLELDFRQSGCCEIAFFALDAEWQGRGAGRWMMNRAIDLAWNEPIERLWVHTCTLDHPRALAFYQSSGFTPFRRRIEVADDPRLSGKLPPDAAPATPVL